MDPLDSRQTTRRPLLVAYWQLHLIPTSQAQVPTVFPVVLLSHGIPARMHHELKSCKTIIWIFDSRNGNLLFMTINLETTYESMSFLIDSVTCISIPDY